MLTDHDYDDDDEEDCEEGYHHDDDDDDDDKKMMMVVLVMIELYLYRSFRLTSFLVMTPSMPTSSR